MSEIKFAKGVAVVVKRRTEEPLLFQLPAEDVVGKDGRGKKEINANKLSAEQIAQGDVNLVPLITSMYGVVTGKMELELKKLPEWVINIFRGFIPYLLSYNFNSSSPQNDPATDNIDNHEELISNVLAKAQAVCEVCEELLGFPDNFWLYTPEQMDIWQKLFSLLNQLPSSTARVLQERNGSLVKFEINNIFQLTLTQELEEKIFKYLEQNNRNVLIIDPDTMKYLEWDMIIELCTIRPATQAVLSAISQDAII